MGMVSMGMVSMGIISKGIISMGMVSMGMVSIESIRKDEEVLFLLCGVRICIMTVLLLSNMICELM